MKILITISYDGTNYNGWQRQTEFNSVQEEVEKALTKVLSEPIKILGASRTDAKVHALDQKAVFTIEKTSIPPDKIYLLVNKVLPEDIKLISSELIYEDFNPLRDVSKKTYIYTLYNGSFQNPLYRNISTYIKDELDVEKMNQASKYFIGTYDFVAFCKNAKIKENTIRTIYESKVYKENNFIYFEITGNGFLHNMVRTIMGVLIDVGLNKVNVEDVLPIILSKDRNLSSKVIAGSGLCLNKIYLK